MGNKIWKIILFVSLIIVGVSSYNIYRLSREYQEGIKEYQALSQYVTITGEQSDKQEVSQAGEDNDEAALEGTESAIPVSIDVKYEELKSINEDFIGWLYYEPLELSYPVVRGNDNDFYVKNTFEKEANSSGAIFMDFLNKLDFTDYNTIIYGHNMRNGTMFGSLKKLLNEQNLIEDNPYFYIFTEEKTYMYEIFAAYITDETSHTYDLITDETEQGIYIDYIKSSAEYLSEKEINLTDKIVTLSTCHGLHTSNRTVIHGVLIMEEDR